MDAVEAWDGVLYPDEIQAIVDTTTLMGERNLDNDGSDASGDGRPVTPVGDGNRPGPETRTCGV